MDESNGANKAFDITDLKDGQVVFPLSTNAMSIALKGYLKEKYRTPHRVVALLPNGTGFNVVAEPDPDAPAKAPRKTTGRKPNAPVTTPAAKQTGARTAA